MTEKLFTEITKWQKETFGQATPLSKLSHLLAEVSELQHELKLNEGNDTDIKMEYADCFFLLFGSAAAYGMSYADICEAIEKKFAINKERRWGKPDKDGVVNHIKTHQP